MSEEKMIEAGKSRDQLENYDSGDSIGILDLAVVVAKNKKRIIIFTVSVMLLVAGATILIPNKFTARTQVLPPQSQSSSSILLGQLGSLGSLAGGSLKNPNDTYIGILNSRTVADNLIARFKLAEVYDVKLTSDARKELQSATVVMSSKENLLSIDVTDKDPKLAAAIANGYIDELQKMTSILAVTEASRRRLFFEEQLQKTKQALINAESTLKQIQQKTGLIKLNEQAEGAIKAVATVKAEIASKEIALSTMRTSLTSNSPEFIRAQQELFGLRAQLSKLETGTNAGRGDISVATSLVPELGLEYTRSVREVKYQEALFEMFAKQFELAKVDEAKEGTLLQVLDTAVVPEKKSKPQRSLLVALTGILAAIFSVLYAFWREVKHRISVNPRNAEQIEKLKKYRKWI